MCLNKLYVLHASLFLSCDRAFLNFGSKIKLEYLEMQIKLVIETIEKGKDRAMRMFKKFTI